MNNSIKRAVCALVYAAYIILLFLNAIGVTKLNWFWLTAPLWGTAIAIVLIIICLLILNIIENLIEKLKQKWAKK